MKIRDIGEINFTRVDELSAAYGGSLYTAECTNCQHLYMKHTGGDTQPCIATIECACPHFFWPPDHPEAAKQHPIHALIDGYF